MRSVVRNILSILTEREKSVLQIQTFLSIIISLLDIAFIGLLLVVVSVYTGNLTATATRLPAVFLDKNSLLLIIVTVVLFSVKNFAGYIITKSQYRFVYGVASRISETNLLNYLESDYNKYVHTDSSVNIRRISQEPIEFAHYVLSSFQHIITQFVLISFTIIAILIYNATLFILLFVLLLPPVILTAKVIRNKLKTAKKNAKMTSEKNLQYLQESLSSYVESNIYQKNVFFKNRYHIYQEKLNKHLADQQTIQVLPARLIEVFAVLGFFLLILLNNFSEGSYFLNIITIGVFIGASYKIIPGIVKILNGIGQIHAYNFTIEHLLKEIKKTSTNEISYSEINSIHFDKVGFDFDKQLVVRNVNLEILPGDFIGIRGVSGSGKTTLLNLLLGFLDTKEGEVRINQMPANRATRQAARKRIAYVKQQAFFIHDTVLSNIILGDDVPDRERLNEALRISGTDLLVRQLPAGLYEVIRENGKNISGGQRQRIALARALYKDFDLLILDEPFSELDKQSEELILQELQLLAASGKMILLVTHNPNGLLFCNKQISL